MTYLGIYAKCYREDKERDKMWARDLEKLLYMCWVKRLFSMLVGCSISLNNDEELNMHMILWMKAAHSLMSHGVKNCETTGGEPEGLEKASCRKRQLNCYLEVKETKRGKQTGWREQREKRHRSMMCTRWSGNDKTTWTWQEQPMEVREGHSWMRAKVS